MQFGAISGSLTKLNDGTSYMIAGANVTIVSESWGAVTISSTGGGGGTPASPVGSVQYNDGGSFGGSADFTYDQPTGRLELTGSFVATMGLSGSLTTLSDGTPYLLPGSNVSIVSASNGAVTISAVSAFLTYKPGGATEGNVYSTWAELMAAFNATSGYVIVSIDDSLGSPTVDAGTHDFERRADFQGANLDLSFPTRLTIPDGAIVKDVRKFQSLDLFTQGTTGPNIQVSHAGIMTFAYGYITTDGTYPVIEIGAGEFVAVDFDTTFVVANTTSPIFSLATATSALFVTLSRGCIIIDDDFVTGVAGDPGFDLSIAIDADIYVDSAPSDHRFPTNPNFLGTYTKIKLKKSKLVEYDDTLAVGSIGDNVQSAVDTLKARWASTTPNAIYTTSSVAIVGNEPSIDAAGDKGTDVFFYVSGSWGSKDGSTPGVALFGGDVVISGTLHGGSPLKIGTDTIITGSLSQGYEIAAEGIYSHAEGTGSIASGDYSHAEGSGSFAVGFASHAEGASITFEGEGGPETYILTASGSCAHAEGAGTSADGDYSHAEGYITFAKSLASHAEGVATSAWAPYSHAEGASTATYGTGSHAEGQGTNADGTYSHAEGFGTNAEGDHSHAEGQQTKSYNTASHAEGRQTFASASWSHAEGYDTDAFGQYAHSEGYQTMAEGLASHAEGRSAKAYASYSHAEGRLTVTSGSYSHAEGYQSKTYGDYSHTEGYLCETFGAYSHAEGEFSDAIGQSSHAEGYSTIANGNYSHSEGYDAEAVGIGSHAEGHTTKSDANYSHAEGYQTVASGAYSHAAGEQTVALGLASYAGGFMTIASGSHQHVIGKYNKRDNTHSLFVVGAGTTDANEFRKDVLRVESGGVEVTGSFWQKNTTVYTSTVGFMGNDAIVDPTTKGSDVFFYTSGSIRSAGTATRGTSLFGGDVVVSGSLSLGSGSNLPTGIVYLDGGSPGIATVTNSLVTANSMIFLTKQANNHPNAGAPVVSSKTVGSFTITTNHNTDDDPVAYLIINPANT